MFVSSKTRCIDGKCIAVEMQFSTVYLHVATQVSNIIIWSMMRKSTDYLRDKHNDSKFLDFLNKLNEDYFDIQGFLKEEERKEGHFETISTTEGEDTLESTSHTGLILSGMFQCRGRRFKFIAPEGYMEKFSPSSFVVDKCLTLLSNHSYWSLESYALEAKTVEYIVSFKGRGTIIAGMGTRPCLHGEDQAGGVRCSVSVNRSSLVVRQNGNIVVSKQRLWDEQDEASLRFTYSDKRVAISFTPSSGGEEERLELDVTMHQTYHLYMRAPPGVHDVKYHSVDIYPHAAVEDTS
mmetsp:Transcript_42685/g.103232  ORF Transcript_42685/g.103232 Transcript_42685/m.103232 type:complete len:293 (-) Transcript_42685:102-980(-)